MPNSITIKDESSGVERTLYLRQDVLEVAQMAKQASQAIKYKEQAYLIQHPQFGAMLCIRKENRTVHFKIETAKEYYLCEDAGMRMTDDFRFTGKPIKK